MRDPRRGSARERQLVSPAELELTGVGLAKTGLTGRVRNRSPYEVYSITFLVSFVEHGETMFTYPSTAYLTVPPGASACPSRHVTLKLTIAGREVGTRSRKFWRGRWRTPSRPHALGHGSELRALAGEVGEVLPHMAFQRDGERGRVHVERGGQLRPDAGRPAQERVPKEPGEREALKHRTVTRDELRPGAAPGRQPLLSCTSTTRAAARACRHSPSRSAGPRRRCACRRGARVSAAPWRGHRGVPQRVRFGHVDQLLRPMHRDRAAGRDRALVTPPG